MANRMNSFTASGFHRSVAISKSERRIRRFFRSDSPSSISRHVDRDQLRFSLEQIAYTRFLWSLSLASVFKHERIEFSNAPLKTTIDASIKVLPALSWFIDFCDTVLVLPAPLLYVSICRSPGNVLSADESNGFFLKIMSGFGCRGFPMYKLQMFIRRGT